MDILGFLAKVIGITGRIGGIFAMSAAMVIFLNAIHPVLFQQLPPSTIPSLMLTGILGTCAVVVDLIAYLWPVVTGHIARNIELKKIVQIEQEHGIKNLTAMYPELAASLYYLHINKTYRFHAKTKNFVLNEMVKSYILKIDDPNFNFNSVHTYYVVPDYIVAELERNTEFFRKLPVPASPPWLEAERKKSWIERY